MRYNRTIKAISSIIRNYRFRKVLNMIDKDSRTLVDIGGENSYFKKNLPNMRVQVADIFPEEKYIERMDIENLPYNSNSFDTVLCLQTLEHVVNPIKAIKELKRITRHQLIITIPKEPMYSVFRLLINNKYHLWTISPDVLRHYLGNPKTSRTMFMGRYYIGEWRK